jgi:hypothetical protein
MMYAAIWLVFDRPMFVALMVGRGGDIGPMPDTIIRTHKIDVSGDVGTVIVGYGGESCVHVGSRPSYAC